MAQDGVLQGGKYAYNDDQETPNTLLASYDYGGREIVFEVRGLLTGGEGFPMARRRRCAGRSRSSSRHRRPSGAHRHRRAIP